MAMIIKTFLAPDEYGGNGIFSDQSVKKGDLVWKYTQEGTTVYTVEAYKRAVETGIVNPKYPFPVERFEDGKMVHYVYEDHDNGRHMNHSDTPNIGIISDPSHPHYKDRESVNVALRDIARGEQLTCDYYEFFTNAEDWLDVETCITFLIKPDRKHKIT